MSSTSAAEQPRPFDRLPNELLVKMLLHLPPPSISLDGTPPPSIANALFDLSLVSRRFNASSRDLLWQGSTINAWSTENSLLQAIAIVAQWPAIARSGCGLRLTYIDRWLPRDWAVVLPGVDRLVAARFQRLDLVDLARFHNLRHVSLDNCRFDFSPTTTVLPHLKSLRLSDVEVTGAPPGASVRAFPVLRHLVLVCSTAPDTPALEPVFNRTFLDQLDSLEVAVEDWHAHRSMLFPLDDLPSSLPILWRIFIRVDDHLHNGDNALLPSSVLYGQHLLLQLSCTLDTGVPTSVLYERAYVEVRRVVALHEHARLRLVLVADLPWRRSKATLAELAAIKALEGDCERRGVALRSCELRDVEDGVVPEFMEFLREEAAGAAGRRS